MIRSKSAFAVCLLAVACESGEPPSASPRARAVEAPAAAQPPPAAPTPAPAPPVAPSAPGKPHVDFSGSIEWHTWAEALPLAQKSARPILAVVYADWCPHCRELGPVFKDPDIEKLAKRFVMVKQNHDDEPEWLQPLNQKYGGYVPRIFFFDSNGKIREELKSGHPRYPYFYAADHAEFLKATMRQAAGS